MSIFKKAAEKGKVSNRHPFLDGKGIYKARVAAVRSGETQAGLSFVALDVELLDARLADPDVSFVPGETRTIMNSEPENKNYRDMFFNTMMTHAHQLAVALWAGSGKEGDRPSTEDLSAEFLEALFGPESILVDSEVQIEVTPRTTKKGNVVWNYTFQPVTL